MDRLREAVLPNRAGRVSPIARGEADVFVFRVLKLRGVRFVYVRTEVKRAIMLAGIACKLLLVQSDPLPTTAGG